MSAMIFIAATNRGERGSRRVGFFQVYSDWFEQNGTYIICHLTTIPSYIITFLKQVKFPFFELKSPSMRNTDGEQELGYGFSQGE